MIKRVIILILLKYRKLDDYYEFFICEKLIRKNYYNQNVYLTNDK